MSTAFHVTPSHHQQLYISLYIYYTSYNQFSFKHSYRHSVTTFFFSQAAPPTPNLTQENPLLIFLFVSLWKIQNTNIFGDFYRFLETQTTFFFLFISSAVSSYICSSRLFLSINQIFAFLIILSLQLYMGRGRWVVALMLVPQTK